MEKIFKALNFIVVSLFLAIFFIACDNDFSTVKSDVLGEGNVNFNTGKVNLPIIAYNKKLDSLQINNLSSNLLGVFNDPVYGQTTASIITQVSPPSNGFSPNFGKNPVIDSVVLSIPYYSKAIIIDSTYTIKDSLYGSEPVHLSLYKNNYFLRDFNPNSSTNSRQNYYSKADGSINNTENFAITQNGIINFDSYKGELLKDTIYTPSNKRIVTVTFDSEGKKTRVKSPPALRFKMDKDFWTTAILDKEGQPELSNENNFKNYFRGLYFKAEANNGTGNLVLLNMASSSSAITIYYSFDASTSGERTQNTYILNLASTSTININRLNTFINTYTRPLTNGNKTIGDEKLYLKGIEGSMAVVDLFGGMVDCDGDGNLDMSALDCFKETYRVSDGNGGYKKDSSGNYILKQLINEARLVIYEDQTMINSTDHKYDRIYAYDVKNNIPTVDYLDYYDPTLNTTNPLGSKIVSLGQREPDSLKYKIRLTQHLNNILIRDSTNTKIGLVLSSNVNLTNNSEILNSGDTVTSVPSASIITPRGTILYGTNASVPENKKMKLELFFTEPK
ncbi:DUF4270 domain-containing protein [Confluentibacter sediminis]|uniref:DUF4270 domain-containing protein n=1 Tax=Confluentibacter sediminis TaxID=2219045 RepID=UPI000DAC9A75|nr:DUF4270 domain-containing protein [Confluentibacter sediminis]